MQIKIRKANEKDIPKLINLLVNADERSKVASRKVVLNYMNINNKLILLALDKEKAIGFTCIKKKEYETKASKFIDLENYGWITYIAVLNSYRNHKLGSKLLKYAELYIKRQFKKNRIAVDCRKIVLDFYIKNKYKITGKYIDKGKIRYLLTK